MPIEVLGVNRIGQISGTTGPNWPLLVDSVGNPLLTDTGRWWNVIGVDEGANARHSDGRIYVFFGDVATNQSGTPPENADLIAWFDDPVPMRHGGHLAMGWNFQLPITNVPWGDGQPDWRFCDQCSTLFWDGDANFKGRCIHGDPNVGFIHHANGENFSLPFSIDGVQPFTSPGTEGRQVGWRFCGNCAALFWTDEHDVTGACPAGGSHVAAGWIFAIPVTPSVQGGQQEWRFCATCHGLFFDGYPSKGVCAGASGGGVRLNAITQDGNVFSPFDAFRAADPIGFTGSLETPNGAFSFDNRMYVFAGFSEEKYSHRRRPGDPQVGQYLFSKDSPAVPGEYATEFLVSPKLGWCARDASRASFESHAPLGFHFVLERDLPQSPNRRSGWRCCKHCEAIFFDGDAGFKGVCQRGGPHEADPAVPGDFRVEVGVPEDGQHQSNWKLCRHCLALYFSLDGQPTGLCPAAGQHESTGEVFRIPHRSIEPDGLHQEDWRFCVKCHSLFWAPADRVHNICRPDRRPHVAMGFNFLVPFMVGDIAQPTPFWRFCIECAALFFEGEPSVCPSDSGSHEPMGFRFTPMHDRPELLDRQANWRRCKKCSGLFFDGFPESGVCPFDGLGHEREFLGPDYLLEHNPGADANNQDHFRFCVRCHGLVRTDQRMAYPWTAPVVVDNAQHPVLEQREGQGLVMIGFDWERFRLSWVPLTPGMRPRFDTIRYYHAGKREWRDTIDNDPGYEMFAHPLPGQYTHVSAAWLRGPGCWIVLFSRAWDVSGQFTQPIVARFSTDLVTWSDEVMLFSPGPLGAYPAFMHDPTRNPPDGINPNLPPSQPDGKDNPGWAYVAFIIDHEGYTTWDPVNRVLNVTYLMSTASPYQVQLMETALRLPDPMLG